MSTENVFESQMLAVMTRMASAMEQIAANTAAKTVTTDEQRAALAVVAIENGAHTFQAIADELGISRSVASRSPGIRRALETLVRDRSVDSREAEDFRYE